MGEEPLSRHENVSFTCGCGTIARRARGDVGPTPEKSGRHPHELIGCPAARLDYTETC